MADLLAEAAPPALVERQEKAGGSDMIVHIVMRNHPLCGFTSDPPDKWPDDHRAVMPEEAHFSNCFRCVSVLHEHDEIEASNVSVGVSWPK